jgi:hypothetical protein
MDDIDYGALLAPVVANRRVILAGGPVAAFSPTAELIHRLGAEAILIVGTDGVGVGPLPDPELATWVATEAPPGSMTERIHAGNRILRDPPASVRTAVEQFDPTAQALVIGTFLNESPELLGRPFLTHRRPEWLALDDKTVIDEVWDAAGVVRAPSAVVALEAGALRRAAAAVDAGAGTVWAADSSKGWHGGAEGLGWVRTDADVDDAVHAYAGRTRCVRVMPFLEGVPCSIHGIVFPDHVVVVRPVEQITLQRLDPPAFVYAGCATFYDPPAAVTASMRAMARDVGAHLRSSVGYRGAFTIDGVVGRDGFLPTELNPRWGAGLSVMLRAQPDLPLMLLVDVVAGGRRLPCDPVALEQTLMAGADAYRAGGTWRPVPGVVPAVDTRPAVGGPGGWRWATDDESASGHVDASPSHDAGFVRLRADADRTPTGPSFAPAAAAFWAFADRELGARLGPLEPATAPG